MHIPIESNWDVFSGSALCFQRWEWDQQPPVSLMTLMNKRGRSPIKHVSDGGESLCLFSLLTNDLGIGNDNISFTVKPSFILYQHDLMRLVCIAFKDLTIFIYTRIYTYPILRSYPNAPAVLREFLCSHISTRSRIQICHNIQRLGPFRSVESKSSLGPFRRTRQPWLQTASPVDCKYSKWSVLLGSNLLLKGFLLTC